jgi:hypothetical protein
MGWFLFDVEDSLIPITFRVFLQTCDEISPPLDTTHQQLTLLHPTQRALLWGPKFVTFKLWNAKEPINVTETF